METTVAGRCNTGVVGEETMDSHGTLKERYYR
jgi:hypothetical protein